MAARAKQVRSADMSEYMPDHAALDDETLCAPRDPPLTPMCMFVATLAACLTNMQRNFSDVIKQLEPANEVLALNCNFGHKAQVGAEEHLKLTRKPRKAGARERKMQGDGTCFNSALEIVVQLSGEYATHAGKPKYYMMKCFTSTGETQIPGAVRTDFSDGQLALQAWVRFLNAAGAGNVDADGKAQPIDIVHGVARPNMINYKFSVRRSCPRALVNLRLLSQYLVVLEEQRKLACARTPTTIAACAARLAACSARLPDTFVRTQPAFPVRKVNCPMSGGKLAFCALFGDHDVHINVFCRGKVNVLGANVAEEGEVIYEFLADLFADNWQALVPLAPLKDSERLARARLVRAASEAKAVGTPAALPVFDQAPTLDDLYNGAAMEAPPAVCKNLAPEAVFDLDGAGLDEM